MRDSFVAALTELAQQNERVILLTADLGFGIFDDYVKKVPDQFLNVGVAEQNMMGVATGLSLEGRVVFAYSIGNFATLRCLEQIRNDAAYHKANVNVVASGGGFTYGQLGMSHHATEDLSILRALPGVTVVAPCDAWEAGQALPALAKNPGVSYLRIEKQTPLDTSQDTKPFMLSKARRIREGQDICLISIGGITLQAMRAAEQLAEKGIAARVVSMHTLKPLDTDEIKHAIRDTGAILSIEENTILGGLGSAVSEVIAETGASIPFKRMGIPDTYFSMVGSQEYLLEHNGLDAKAICEAASNLVSKKTT